MTGPRILFSGYFGFGNFGDDAILYCMARQFKKMRPEIQLSALTQNVDDVRWLADGKQSFGVKPYKRMKPADILRAVKNCDLFISGGGGLFQDTTSVKSVVYYAGLIHLALRMKKKVMIFSQGLGPLRSPISKKIVSSVLRNVHDATFRDEASCALAKKLSGRDFECTADPVFLLEPSAEKADALDFYSFIENPSWETRIGIFLRDLHHLRYFYLNFNPFLETAVKEGTAFAYLIFQKGDLALTWGSLRPHSFMYPVECSPPAVFSFYEKLDVCLCMRYHSAVCAFLSGKPALGFSYDPKVKALFESFGLSEYCLPLDASAEQMTSVYEKLMREKVIVMERIQILLPSFRERALKSFSKALHLMP